MIYKNIILLKKMITFRWIEENYNSMEDDHFLYYPEFCVKKLRLSKNLLNNISGIDKNNRSRDLIVNWMIYSGISKNDFNNAKI